MFYRFKAYPTMKGSGMPWPGKVLTKGVEIPRGEPSWH